jgi:signal transduction histidine kinase
MEKENSNEKLISSTKINFNFTFILSDILIKQLWILLPFNNFFCYFISNICFFMMFLIFLGINYFNFDVNELLSVIIYFLFICLSSYFSRKIMLNEKYLYIINSQNNKNYENEISLGDNTNTGCLKFSEYEIKEKNNFFEKEGEFFKQYLKKYDENHNQKENFSSYKEAYKRLNTLYLNNTESLGDAVGEKIFKFTHEEIKEILKNIFLNIDAEQNFKTLFDTFKENENLKSISKNKNIGISNLDYKKINHEDSKVDQNEFNDLEKSTNNILNVTLDLKSDTIIQDLKKYFKIPFEQYLEFFYENYSSFKNFTSIGKCKINQGVDKILSLEILVRVRINNSKNEYNIFHQKSIEFIFNDTTKNDLSSTLKNLLIKTGQYLHDFKNPLICIQNELTELKEETEVIMAKLCQQNEFIQNLKRSPLSSSQRINNTNKNLNISIEDCLQILVKFEFANQMSEYCQSMIGSYEDFSRSILSPQSIAVNFQNFDLIKLLNFIDNFMNIQINRLNKNLNFKIFLENFEEENKSKHDERGDITSRHDTNYENNIYLSHKKEINDVPGILDNLEYFNSKKRQEIINTDESKLKRVLLNILSNSIKFTPSGSIKLTVKKEKLYSKANYNFSIKDTGIGMSESELKKLFTPFFSNNTSEMNKSGVGLGLLNVKEITEKLGGGLKVTSQVNEGTTMSFLVQDKSEKSHKPTDENSILIIREGRSSNNSNEGTERYEFQEQPTIKITDPIFMINDKLKIKELNDYNCELIECEILSSFNSNQDSFRKEKTTLKYSHPEIVLNSNLSNNKNLRDEKKNVNSNFLLPFSNISQTSNRTPSLTVINYSPRDTSSKSLNNLMKFPNLNLKSNRSIKQSLQKTHSKIFLEKLKMLTPNNFCNLKFVSEITYEILVPIKNVYDSLNQISISCKNCTVKFKNNEEENFFKRIRDYRKKSTAGLNSSSFKRNSVFLENQVPSQESRKSSETKRNISVLIIDDEKSIRSFNKSSLKKISEKENVNFIIEEADDGCEGLSKIFGKIFKDQEIYDLIITDDSMTLIDGSHLYNILNFIIESEQYRKEKSTSLIDKFIICSSDIERVKNKILFFERKNFYINKNLILCEKPLKLDLLKSLIEINS